MNKVGKVGVRAGPPQYSMTAPGEEMAGKAGRSLKRTRP